ncbi:MAG: hypothetical protein HQL27_00085 [Candidatus Omnitrophica bacterium]|nr:hypothetical protein [Candidatus Omnitrophota bacterium]
MENREYLSLGKTFYEWHKDGKLKFLYQEESKNLSAEVDRISELIEYVKSKKEKLAK